MPVTIARPAAWDARCLHPLNHFCVQQLLAQRSAREAMHHSSQANSCNVPLSVLKDIVAAGLGAFISPNAQ